MYLVPTTAEDELSDDVMTIEEAAAFLRVNPETVRRHAQRGTLPARKVGGWRFSRAALQAFLSRTPTTRKDSTCLPPQPKAGAVSAAFVKTRVQVSGTSTSRLMADESNALRELKTARRRRNSEPLLKAISGGKPS
jgi:excisionase family DNA binding protein